MFKSHKKTIVAGAELFLIIITVLAATYAWMTNNEKAETDTLTLKADAHYNLLLSLDGGETWVTETSLNLPANFEFKHEITGNGVNMYIPSNKRDDGTPISFTTATAGTDYLEFDVMLRLAANVSVFLDEASYIRPAVGTEASSLLGSEVERISIGGNFSRDLIASSVRVAFMNNTFIDGEYFMEASPRMVWAPNKEYEIACPSNCTASITSTNAQDYNYVEAANLPVVETKVQNIKEDISASGETQNAYGDPILTTIDTNENQGIKKITVRIWIEGNDRDNVTALTGGLFQMNLQFSAINKGLDNTAPEVSVNNNSIFGYDSTMEYSINDGISWIKYQDNNNPTFETGDVVKVRKSETIEYFASSSTTLNF